MKRLSFFLFFLCIQVLATDSFASEVCDIYVHGYTPDGESYFGDLPRQVIWDSQKDIAQAAEEVSTKILDFYKECDPAIPIVLRPHSYGAAIVQYILAKGYLFQELVPYHNFVQVYLKTVEVYAYTGAYHGTPIMDLVCSSVLTRTLGEFFGRNCVKSLSTSKVHNVSFLAQTPGVVTHLVTSSDRGGLLGSTGLIISKHLVSFWSFLRGERNQNDNTLPLYSTRACEKKVLLKNSNSYCRKLDQNYFFDFHHTESQHHFEFLNDKEFLRMRSES